MKPHTEDIPDEQIEALIPPSTAWEFEVGVDEAVAFARAVIEADRKFRASAVGAERERDRLRAAQTAAVMPLIGPLLDAWEQADREEMDEQPELVKWLKAINTAMETASDESIAPAKDVRDSDKQLMDFYSVESLPALIDAQEEHIRRLQEKLPPLQQPAFTRVREG